ncbi:LAMA5 protein, partial [Polypterus senegalus]
MVSVASKRDCIEKFGQRTVERIIKDSDVICTTEYSRIVPLENGEIVVSLVNGRPGAMNFSYSPDLRDFTKATSIRLRFLRTNTLLGHLMGKALRDPTVTRRYYYSIKDISIGGRCVCNGHAEACDAKDPTDPYRLVCDCQHNTCGGSCERCCPGFNQLPWKPATTDSANECEPCACDSKFTDGTCEDLTGRCYCKPNYTGENCDSCAEGYMDFPACYPVPTYHNVDNGELLPAGSIITCKCTGPGVLNGGCNPETGECYCRSGFEGYLCDRCAPRYFHYPLCQLCGCSIVGSMPEGCDLSGRCICKPGFDGPRCEQCKSGFHAFPNCQGEPFILLVNLLQGSCDCRPYVEGAACDRCKPLYWNLTPDNPYGCTNCHCSTDGTISGVAECSQGNGQCFCKPNVCSRSCSMCKEGYYNLQSTNYFGCQGCSCDIGGSIGLTCDERSGRCQCRQNVEGRRCNQPKKDYYFPDLHHLKFEIEDGTMLDGRPVRFGHNPLEFESFSWRGYAQMSPIQNKVRVAVHVKEAELYLFHFILRYVNSGTAVSYGKITAFQAKRKGSEQSKQIIFAPSSEPTFVTVPQNSFVEPFVLNPGSWSVIIEAEGILLINVQLRIPVSRPGGYVLVLEYTSEEENSQTLMVSINTLGTHIQQESIIVAPCRYSFLCRSVAIDTKHRVSVFELATEAVIQLTADKANFFLHKVFLIPHNHFAMEYVKPRMHCISTHGTFSPDSGACIPSRFQKPSQSIILKEGQTSSVPNTVPVDHGSVFNPVQVLEWPQPANSRPFTAVDSTDLIWLHSSQNTVAFTSRVQNLGRYAVILHFFQPYHPTFPVEVFLNGGRIWQGYANATFCPHGYGCRSLLIAENQVILDVTDHAIYITVHVPEGKTLWLDYILVVPEESYSSNYLDEEPLDKSYDFINLCGVNSFYINPATVTPFCKNSAISLSAFYNNGARPCACHEAGAVSPTCEAFGGQCSCRPNVIGRDCSRCATGYWGFPNCRPCQCGTRLCDEVTGQCICPPRTLKPDCTVCEPQTFGCHPLVGCEECNCSSSGITAFTGNSCDIESGQCRCKINIIGRQCDRCSSGFYGYPNCRRCQCNEAGTEADSCDPVTGQCHCKENVEGLRCDQCKAGTFHLDTTNPKGCTSCFCFGATDRCRSSDKFRTQLMDMNGWVLLNGERQEIPVSVNFDQNLVEADLRDVPDVSQELHWSAPQSYLGDKVSSYGGFLSYRLLSQSMSARGDSAAPLPEASRPDVILKGNQMTLVYLDKNYAASGDPHEGRVLLVEGNFRHAQTRNPVSREELMMVLVSLEMLQIRALHSQSSLAVSLVEVVLEGATDTFGGKAVSNVEICMCPANYRGDSCQDIIGTPRGFFLENVFHVTAIVTQISAFMGQAYVFFAVRCIERVSSMQCLCMPGYAGPKCERCAPGFYGNPMVIGSSCQPCHCNGNTDSNMLFSECDSLTGVCTGCMHNSAGQHCEICAPGYFGDAIVAKNCTKCDCSPCGTAACDPRTGMCHCKPGVTGLRCDRCQDGFYGYDSCTGCNHCDCSAAAAITQQCHPVDGHCTCQPGVNGPQCLQCAPDFWGYSPNGCNKCHCNGGSCNPRSGECTCQNGLTGRQCDTCIQDYHIPVLNGVGSLACQPCDNCVLVLLEDLNRLSALFPDVQEQLSNLNASSAAWGRLHNLSKTIKNVSNEVYDYKDLVDAQRKKTDDLENEGMNLDQDLDALMEKATMTKRKASTLEGNVAATHKQAEDLIRHIGIILKNVEGIIAQLNKSSSNESSSDTTEEMRQKLTEAEKMLREMRERTCFIQKRTANVELEMAKELIKKVRNEMANRWEENNKQIDDIMDELTNYNAKLMDLRDAINEAINKTAQAEELNNLNENMLDESQKKMKDLQQKTAEVKDLLRMAEDALSQVADLLQMLMDLQEEFEKMSAHLDGAKQPLEEKKQKFAPASSKIPLVEEAERHAEMLYQLSKNLTNVIQDTNQDGFIQRAINASNAYSSIIEAVRNAEKAAEKADEAASDALQNVKKDNLRDQADLLKNKSYALAEEAKNVQMDFENEIIPRLQDLENKLKNAKNKTEVLSKDLKDAQEKLNIDTGDTTKKIQNAKTAAEDATTKVINIENKLNKMKESLDEWKKQYGNSSTINEEFQKAFQEANESVSSLEDAVPLLIKKLEQLQSRSTQMPNISENILRIRQLISQARNAASKVKVPMKFNGTAGVQVRNPSNLQDLVAYTSLRFFITLPEAKRKRQAEPDKQFIFYLGNKDYGKMSITVDKGTAMVTKGDVIAQGDVGLLNLTASEAVFYVGGYPETFTPPPELQYPNFKGCIELDTLNEEVISLYNFEKTFQLDTSKDRPCGRTKSQSEPWINDGAYFDGSGYAEVEIQSALIMTSRFEQEVKILSYNGILFFFEGKIQVIIRIQSSKTKIYVRMERMVIFNVDYDGPALEFSQVYYLGGVPKEKLPQSLKVLYPEGGSVKGCFRSIKALDIYKDLKRMNTTGVSFGCSSDLLLARTAKFNGDGYLDLSLDNVPSLVNDFYAGFGFRTSQSNGLMFSYNTADGNCQIYLENGKLVLKSANGDLTTRTPYADDNSHYVTLYSNINGVRLYVDGKLEKNSRKLTNRKRRQHREVTTGHIYIGGVPESFTVANMTGCISNFFVKREKDEQMVVDFLQSKLMNVALSCPASRQPQLMQALSKRNRGGQPNLKGEVTPLWQPSVEPTCNSRLPKSINGAFQFSSSVTSRLEFDGIPDSFQERSHFSMDVRLNSTNGLLFYVSDDEEDSAMALYVSNSRFVLFIDIAGKKLKIRSREKYSDGHWHTVFFSREKSKLQLVIDGLNSQSGTLPGAISLLVSSPFYVGGVPAGKCKKHAKEISVNGFVGCIKNVKLDRKPLGAPARTFGVVHCFESSLESGVYFAAEGGHLTLGNSFMISQDFEMMLEVRPLAQTGLLFHIGREGHHLTLYTQNGKVTVEVDNGAGRFSVSLMPKQSLCNGHWHHIAVIKRQNVIQIDMDTEGNHAVGPKGSRFSNLKEMAYLGGVPVILGQDWSKRISGKPFTRSGASLDLVMRGKGTLPRLHAVHKGRPYGRWCLGDLSVATDLDPEDSAEKGLARNSPGPRPQDPLAPGPSISVHAASFKREQWNDDSLRFARNAIVLPNSSTADGSTPGTLLCP